MRLNDPRTAQTVTILVLMPVFCVVINQVFGSPVASPILALEVIAVLSLIAAVSIWGQHACSSVG